MGKTLQQRAEEALKRLRGSSKTIEDMDDQELAKLSERVSNEIKVLAMAMEVVVKPTPSLKEEVLDRVLDLGRVEWIRAGRSQQQPIKSAVPFQEFEHEEEQKSAGLDW